MRRQLISVLLALAGATIAAGTVRATDAQTTANSSREAFAQPVAGLSEAERDQFFRGRTLVRQSWVIAPALDNTVAGLGPLYNRLACVSCHAKNGRGRAPDGPDERMQSMLVRLSVPGRKAHGGPNPHPAYGDQLNEEGIPGVPGEGRAFIYWEEQVVQLADGEKVSLRRPRLEFRELAYGALGDVMTSPRVGQQLVGLGLLEAVPTSDLERLAKEAKPDGVKGKVNLVWNPETQRGEAGRFGHKANMPSLRAQIAGAFVGDMGITSPLFPNENCTAVETACQQAPSGGHPELTAKQLDDAEFYVAHLAAPAQRDTDNAQVRDGAARFKAVGCSNCHRPELPTGQHPKFRQLGGQAIHPFTDLLVHDMGAGLADGRPDFLASGSEWRTPPLWGIGLTAKVSEHSQYLHDGRARNLLEAVMWHDGEAAASRSRFAELAKSEREALLRFLSSL